MANTYSQLYIHLIFAVHGRQNLIPTEKKEELQKYISGIIKNAGCKQLANNNMPDHFHVFIGLNPDISISSLVEKIKSNSSKWINENKLIYGKFSWQRGYGAFSYSKSQITQVINYINNQEEHHKKQSFKEEYIEFLEKFKVEYESKYLFEWI